MHSQTDTYLRAQRRGRGSRVEAEDAVRDLLASPFALSAVTPILVSAFDLAQPPNQLSYDDIFM